MEYRHSIENAYEYPAGRGMTAYLEGLRDGKLIGSECKSCGHRIIPPLGFCTNCISYDVRFVEAPDIGRVVTWTSEPDGNRWVLVCFDGFEGGVLHRFSGAQEPYIGMRVRPKFRERRIGSVLDLICFESV
ncbi:MAG: zinc ribbon domain-containing protein [Thaumarchaeota archaeon]|nr:zinc ribbon domain-containing protein [Candidatus Calditenuaceae archaeon]MDW8186565.1 zinc ribbon domain-containing protein [Nitrososphaerota archaeon]